MDDTTIQALQKASLYPHETSTMEVCQTHISWVILTGTIAYKIKKPVDFGFCDFTTLEKRKYFCELEVELNKRLAPQIYLGVVAITGTAESPEIDGDGPVIDYAIKMEQFDNRQLLSIVHKTEGLSRALLISIANQLATFHDMAETVSSNEPFGTPEYIWAPMQDNFQSLKTLEPSKSYAPQVDVIESWAKQQFKELKPLLEQRKAKGFIKACHGDIHLGNMVLHQGKPLIFDCIEFNDDFRNTDTVNDIAFLAMDLDDKGYQNLAHFFCNRYFEATQDVDGIKLLTFYKSYRAMVRAKVMALTTQGVPDESAKIQLQADMKSFLELAQSYLDSPKPSLTITFGPSGCGKSHHTDSLLIETKAFRLRSDVIRKQMAGLDPYLQTPDSKKTDLYSESFTHKVYQELAKRSKTLLEANIPVIIDATFLKAWQRELFLNLSKELKVPFKILSFDSDPSKLKSRLNDRNQTDQTSDADSSVLDKQLNWLEPLSESENQFKEAVS